MMKINKRIGGFFAESDHELYRTLPDQKQVDELFPTSKNGKDCFFFETGIDALASIINEIPSTKANYTLWTPANFCYESLARLKTKIKSPIEFQPYKDSSDLLISRDKTHLFLFFHLNTFDKQSSVKIKKLKQQYPHLIVIEDFVQAPLDMAHFTGDYAFNSLRKFSSLELSVAYTHQVSSTLTQSPYYSLKKQAAKLKSQFYQNPSVAIEDKYLALNKQAESLLLSPEIYLADSEEVKRLNNFDFLKVKQIREKNYACLHESLASNPGLHILSGQYMYFMMQTPDRDFLRKKLIENDIFPVIHWLDSNSTASKTSLSLHIDQRYTEQDMERVAGLIRDFLSEIKN